MTTYNIEFIEDGAILKVGFGEPANNDQIVKDAHARLEELKASGEMKGGTLIRITGAASVPVAMVLAHHLVHLYQAVSVLDPKLGKFVVVAAHGVGPRLGDLLD